MQLFAYAILGFALAEATLRQCRYFMRLFIKTTHNFVLLAQMVRVADLAFTSKHILNRVITKVIVNINNVPVDQTGTGLTRGALVNEPGFQGLGISNKYENHNKYLINGSVFPLRSARLVMNSSLTKVNCCFKTGSSAKVENTLKNIGKWDYCCVYIWSTPTSCPEQTRTRNYIQTHSFYSEKLNTGNPGQIISNLITEVITTEILPIIYRAYCREVYNNGQKSVVYTLSYLKIALNKTTIMSKGKTIKCSRLTSQELLYRYGGKIIEKANVKSNYLNNGIRSLIYTKGIGDNTLVINKVLQYKSSTLHKVKVHISLKQRGMQNSILFIKSDNYKSSLTRNYSLKAYREGIYPSNDKDKNIIWDGHRWGVVGESVHKRQIKLSEIAEKFGIYDKRVVKLQEALALSLEFRLLAVYNVTTNKGSKTPGHDGIILEDKISKSNMVEELKNILKDNNYKSYKAGPIKRVYIPKRNGKLRPLGIPNIKDRCLQELLRLVLDPIVELSSDPHSYGFRKYRSAKNAIGAIRVTLQSTVSKDNKYILDADIKGFFDNISHSWLLENVPLGKSHKKILKNWLKARIIDKGKLGLHLGEGEQLYPEAGTPQGGIISPTLANFVLNGLESTILQSIWPIVKNKEQSLKIYKKDGTRSSVRLGVKCIRYADDFVILARSKRILTQFVKPAVVRFLGKRGLALSEEKTKIFNLRNHPLDFLGYRFKYQEKWRKSYSFFKEKIGRSGIAVYPNREKLIEVTKKLKEILKKSTNESAFTLITKLNPIIRGWSNYFNLGESTYYRNKLRYYLYNLVWQWAKSKHPKWGKKSIARIYFLGEGAFKGRKWTFRGMTHKPSRYGDNKGGKYTYLIDPTIVVNTVSAIKFIIPNALLPIHGYHRDYLNLIECQTKNNLMSLGKHESFKGKLYKIQKGICTMCNKPLLVDIILKTGTLHIDHIKPISEGGSKSKISNMRLIHIWCHKVVHAKK
jgi:RNA-directed DNA polymerase